MFYKTVLQKIRTGNKQHAILIDPEATTEKQIRQICISANLAKADLILIGGSLISTSIKASVDIVKQNTDIPVFIFPGNLFHISDEADGMFLLSLISGRNPELLIGNHIIAAPFLKKSKLEIIPVGYILIESGSTTSVEYISQTMPIPSHKPDIAAATAIAGELLGLKMIYLEAGSGADIPVPVSLIAEVKKNINIPLVIGGGLRTEESIRSACKAGADIVVTGNVIESNPDCLAEFTQIIHNCGKSL